MKDLYLRVSQANLATVLISVCTIAFLVIGKELLSPLINKKVKLRFPIPYELLAMIVATILSAIFSWKVSLGVMTVGEIPAG